MQLQMKTHCEKCGALVEADGQAYICSYECTFCSVCASELKGSCPNCGGELIRRPRRTIVLAVGDNLDSESGWWGGRPWLIWALSFGVWTLVALAFTGSIYALNRSRGYPMSFTDVLGLELSEILTYAPLTPLALGLSTHFPIQGRNWKSRSLLHLSFALVFSIAHITLRGMTPYAGWDPKVGGYVSGVWNSQAHIFEIKLQIFKNLFLSDAVVDITGTYVPILLIAHALSYYRKLRDRQLHSARLEVQLAKSHLQALKSHLQPHFLFNTLHSISALMFTDVGAADQMMTRLSDLLRMSLESSGILTCLKLELEFVAAYLEIEKVRLRDRLNVVFDIAAETLDAQVPSLLLQPLVENAIQHGISRLDAGGNVLITASRDGLDLCLVVRDNGPGLDKSNDDLPRGGLGLRTTRERLQTLYGTAQRFDIHSAANGGVEVSVRIPFRTESQSSMNEVLFEEATSSLEGTATSNSGHSQLLNRNISKDLS